MPNQNSLKGPGNVPVRLLDITNYKVNVSTGGDFCQEINWNLLPAFSPCPALLFLAFPVTRFRGIVKMWEVFCTMVLDYDPFHQGRGLLLGLRGLTGADAGLGGAGLSCLLDQAQHKLPLGQSCRSAGFPVPGGF